MVCSKSLGLSWRRSSIERWAVETPGPAVNVQFLPDAIQRTTPVLQPQPRPRRIMRHVTETHHDFGVDPLEVGPAASKQNRQYKTYGRHCRSDFNHVLDDSVISPSDAKIPLNDYFSRSVPLLLAPNHVRESESFPEFSSMQMQRRGSASAWAWWTFHPSAVGSPTSKWP